MKNPFPIISAVNEALALSNECQQLLEMVTTMDQYTAQKYELRGRGEWTPEAEKRIDLNQAEAIRKFSQARETKEINRQRTYAEQSIEKLEQMARRVRESGGSEELVRDLQWLVAKCLDF